MQYGKTTLLVFLASVSGLLPGLCGPTAVFAEQREPSPFQATAQERAAAYLQEQITEISEQLLKDFPKDIHFVQTAVSFHRLCQNYYMASGVLEQASKDLPDNFWVHHIAADLYFKNGEYEKALASLQKAAALSPENLNVQVDIAETLFHLGRYAKAVEILEKKIKTFPNSAGSHWLLGQAYIQLGQLEKAKEYYIKALAINPEHLRGNYWLAKVCMRLKQPEEAKKYIQAHKDNRVKKEEQRQEWAETMVLFSDNSGKEIEVFPRMLRMFTIHAMKCYEAQNNVDTSKRLLEKTEAAFEKAIEIDSQQHRVFQQSASFYLESEQKLVKAQENVKKALALKETAESYYILGLIYEKNDNYNDALTAFEKAVKLNPKNNTYKVKFNDLFERNL